jgi:hypothetical protein
MKYAVGSNDSPPRGGSWILDWVFPATPTLLGVHRFGHAATSTASPFGSGLNTLPWKCATQLPLCLVIELRAGFDQTERGVRNDAPRAA